jgi:hypothetical protein
MQCEYNLLSLPNWVSYDLCVGKDKMIEDLECENNQLKTGACTADAAMCDLTSSEHTLKFSIEDRVSQWPLTL